jgi:hypothetical protein
MWWFTRYTRVTSTDANFSGNGFKHLRLLWETLFVHWELSADFRLGSLRLSGLSADQAARLKYR